MILLSYTKRRVLCKHGGSVHRIKNMLAWRGGAAKLRNKQKRPLYNVDLGQAKRAKQGLTMGEEAAEEEEPAATDNKRPSARGGMRLPHGSKAAASGTPLDLVMLLHNPFVDGDDDDSGGGSGGSDSMPPHAQQQQQVQQQQQQPKALDREPPEPPPSVRKPNATAPPSRAPPPSKPASETLFAKLEQGCASYDLAVFHPLSGDDEDDA
jgi:hypothetical protein